MAKTSAAQGASNMDLPGPRAHLTELPATTVARVVDTGRHAEITEAHRLNPGAPKYAGGPRDTAWAESETDGDWSPVRTETGAPIPVADRGPELRRLAAIDGGVYLYELRDTGPDRPIQRTYRWTVGGVAYRELRDRGVL